MKQTTLLLTTALLLILATSLTTAATYNEDDTVNIQGADYNISTISAAGQVVFETAHGRFSVRAFDCDNHDIYLICVNNLSDDPVEHFPDRYELDITWEVLCEDCVAWGQECTEEKSCQGACVHGTCRPRSPWCGDGICDEGQSTRTCPQDCPPPTTNQTTTNTTNTTSTPPEDNQTTNQTQQPLTNQTTTTTNQTSQEPTLSDERSASNVVEENPNWLAGALIIFGGLALLLVVFNRKKHKQEKDLYSYRK